MTTPVLEPTAILRLGETTAGPALPDAPEHTTVPQSTARVAGTLALIGAGPVAALTAWAVTGQPAPMMAAGVGVFVVCAAIDYVTGPRPRRGV